MSDRAVRIKKLVIMAILTALAVVLITFVHFPLFPAAPFLQYDPADVPILIGAFAFGPVAGVVITVLASLIQAFLISGDGPYGFLMHVIATGVLALISSVIYRRKHTRSGAVLGLICGTVAMGLVMMVANHFITPYYMSTAETFAAMQQTTDALLLPVILPFNLLKAGINSAVTFLVYKAVSRYIIHGEPAARRSPDKAGSEI